MKLLKSFLLFTDLGFLVYWTVIALHLIPSSYLFHDYLNPLAVAWNWSFLPLDLAISGTGLCSVFLYQRNHPSWHSLALISLILTFCSGLQALAFWSIRGDFDLAWWLPNAFLLVYPLWFLPQLIGRKSQEKKGVIPDAQGETRATRAH